MGLLEKSWLWFLAQFRPGNRIVACARFKKKLNFVHDPSIRILKHDPGYGSREKSSFEP
jgi:hypothetical protein